MDLKKIGKHLDVFFRDVTALGSYGFFFLLLLLILSLEKIQLFWQVLFGFGFTLLAVVIIRMFYFKDRPQRQQFSTFIERIDAASFPSLHTARIVMLTLLLIDYFQNDLATLFFTGVAFLVMYSRVHLRKHDWVDIAGGIILGVITFFLALMV